MKKWEIILIGIILVTPVSALFGGESESILHLDKCNNLTVDVIGDLIIEDGEYNFIDCSKIENNTWFCNCDNNYTLILNTSLNTINTYDFEIVYTYLGEIVEESSSSGGSPSSGGRNHRYYNQDKIIKANRTIVEEIIIGGDIDEHGCLIAAGYTWNETDNKCVREWEKTPIEETIEEPIPPSTNQEVSKTWILWVVGSIFIIIIGGLFWYGFKK